MYYTQKSKMTNVECFFIMTLLNDEGRAAGSLATSKNDHLREIQSKEQNRIQVRLVY
jgi:hypothetical protein